jgi:uncharacterized protein YfaS (alpha-2-macroglobulin family)
VKRSLVTRGTAWLVLCAFVSSSCGGKSTTGTNPNGTGGSGSLTNQVLQQTDDLPEGLDLRLSDGKQLADAYDRSKIAAATKISDADATAILDRVQSIKTAPDDTKPFALRDRSQPPPRTGKTIKDAFPPPPTKSAVPVTNDAGKELTVLRFQPEGDVKLAPQLSITFSQAMVAVTSQDDAAATVPVKLTPTPAGTWRWIGTRTLLFDPDVRFPQATTYKVEIPAGTKSAVGNTLKKAVSFTFETPAPVAQTMWPQVGPTKRDVGMFVTFDQKIDPAKVLDKITVKAGGKKYGVTLLDAAEIDKDADLKALVAGAKANDHDGRWLAFRANDLFPTDTAVSVTLGKGTPSAEGPNKTTSDQSFDFRTYAPLKIVRAECGWSNHCPPSSPFSIEFNNPLDANAFADELLTVSPDIPALKIQQSGNYVTVYGATKAQTTYKVTVSGGVLDEFGQTLGKDQTLTFKVGPAEPTFFGPSGLVVVDPASKSPGLDVFTTNYDGLKVQLYAVEPSDFPAFASYLRNQWNRKKPPKLPGKRVFDKLVRTTGDKDALVETHVELEPALAGKTFGHAIAVIEPYPWSQSYDPPRLVTWAQATKLAVDAYVDDTELIAFATNLADGSPVDGVALSVKPWNLTATTDDKGMATLALSDKQLKGSGFLTATKGDDVAFVTDDAGWWGEYPTWIKQKPANQLAWYTVDDRQMYRPGEEVHLKGFLRSLNPGEGGDIGGVGGLVSSIAYTVRDSMNNEIGKGSAKVNAAGGWDSAFTLPKTPNLGYASIELKANGKLAGSSWHGFQIQEFRRPEFEVTATASQGPFVVGSTADVTVAAKYYAGGGLPGAPVNWYVYQSQTSYTPPNRDDFVFGEWRPWWGYRSWWMDSDDAYKAPKTFSHDGKTDASGNHVVHMDFLTINPAMPVSVSAQASVVDVNRQSWSATVPLIVHPSLAYIGLKTARPYVDKGDPIDLDVIGVDLDGKAVVGRPMEIRSVRLDWEYEKGKYVTKELDPQTCTLTSAADVQKCSLPTKEGGTYQITATILDDKNRPNQTKLTVWVTGGDVPPSRDLQREEVQLIPDKKEYRPGDTAELLLQAPFFPAEAVISWRRSGILKTERVRIDAASAKVKVPIADAHVPNLYVQVDLVGMAARTDDKGKPDASLPKRPAYAVGTINLPIPARSRTLTVTVEPSAAKVGPGDKAALDVNVTDASGKPVTGAEVAVIVVDESILALSGYQFPSPIDFFYGQRGPGARDFYTRSYVTLAKPDPTQVAMGGDDDYRAGWSDRDGDMAGAEVVTLSTGARRGRWDKHAEGAKSAPARVAAEQTRRENKKGKMDAKDSLEEAELDQLNLKLPAADPSGNAPGGNTPIAVRTNFNPLAAFAPEAKTDASGKAKVEVKMPDNLTRYRIVAIAASGDKNFGKGESAITARLPLMVRPSPPRFLNFGDTFSLPVVVQNQTDAAMKVKVAVRATNATITDGLGREVSVPANDRVEILFPAAAAMAGTARFQLAATSGSVQDAAELSLPVWTPATTEAFATYGVLDDGAVAQPVALPGKVVKDFGGLEISTASTNLQSLTDAMLYLVTYPFECSEQRASRILAIAALKDVLTSFAVKDMPKPKELEARVADDLDRLASMQNYDGGFPIWERGYESWPFLSVHVTNALARAKAKGFKVDADMLSRAQNYLQNIEQYYPWYYGPDIRRTISSYALYVRKQLGDLDIKKAQSIVKEAGGAKKLSMEANGWLLGTFAGNKDASSERTDILKHLNNQVSETAGAANWSYAYSDGAHLILHSDRRVDGVILESLIQEEEKNDLIPKVVTGLLGHRTAGRWLNTSENSFVLLALDLYFQTYEKVTPDFVAKAWLGDNFAGSHAFKGRQTDRFQIDVPMKWIADDLKGKGDLVLQKDGKGRLYYRVGMTYAPEDLKLPAADYGFAVERTYEPVDNPADVVRQKDGSWKIKAGAKVRVRLTMVNENRRYHVALVDPLPAGLEAMNPELAVTGAIPQDPNEQKAGGSYWWWYRTWYEHQNLRDERTEAFTTLLWEGVHDYSYVARATTPGTFVVPPAKAEEMYRPETFGRSASDKVIVE